MNNTNTQRTKRGEFIQHPSKCHSSRTDRLQKTIDLQINRTNSLTWYTSGNLQTKTDERGLTITYYWDGLNRLTGTSDSRGTTTNLYYKLDGTAYPNSSGGINILDLTATKDRMGFWTTFDYDVLRRKVGETNANGTVTRYAYCDCGGVSYITNAFGTPIQQVTYFDYDHQGNRIYELYADGYSVTNWFDSLRRLTTTADPQGYRWFTYNNIGLVTMIDNPLGVERATAYDLLDRPIQVVDANGVTVTNTFDDLNRLRTRGYPDGGVEKFGYSARGLTAYTNQIGMTNFFVYDEAGRKTFETNANRELIRYTNNAAGDLLSLADGKNQTTRWHYDQYGRVTNKLDQAGTEILRYQYDADDRLTNRWSAAKGNTAYSYDSVGNLTFINYPSSSDVALQYDKLNRLTNMVDSIGTTKYTYTAGNQLLTEDGPLATDAVTNTYLNRLRTALSLQQPTGVWTNGFAYDSARRLTNVVSPAGAFAYQFAASGVTRHPSRISLPNTSYITNAFDGNARLIATYLKKSDNTVFDSYSYVYNPANQRTNLTRADASTMAYTYDKIGQLKFGRASVSSEGRAYAYDAAWNLTIRTNNSAQTTFTLDNRNQLSSDSFNTHYFYDTNGNLSWSQYGTDPLTWTTTEILARYEYDDENRLIGWTNFDYNTSSSPQQRTEFYYDGLGRLRKRIEYQAQYDGTSFNGWAWSGEAHYVYDGWRVIQERDVNNTPTVSYTRGTDLSGTLEGAGGIGGLLARSSGYSSGNWTTHNFYFADGNGNITYMLNNSQAMVASYRYDPFGNAISKSGTLADANIYRFSSKEIHANSGMYYYGYRFYDPNLQRWLNRDPIAENGGFNLYAYAWNDPIQGKDSLGLWTLSIGISFSLGAGIGGSINLLINIDGGGGLGVSAAFSKGLHGGAGGSATVMGQWTNARCINDLRGGGWELGGSGGEGIVGGGGIVAGDQDEDGTGGYSGLYAEGGVGFGTPVEGHLYGSSTAGQTHRQNH